MFDNLSRFYFNKGLSLVREDQIGPALQNLDKAVSYNTDNIEAWNLAGLCYYRLGKYKTAEYCWTQSVNKRLEGNAAGAYLADLRGTLEETAPYFFQTSALCREERYGQAARIVSKEICSRFDSSARLLNYLGVLQQLAGKTDLAVQCWTNVISLDKSNTDARLYLEDMEKRPRCKLLQWIERLRKILFKKGK